MFAYTWLQKPNETHFTQQIWTTNGTGVRLFWEGLYGNKNPKYFKYIESNTPRAYIPSSIEAYDGYDFRCDSLQAVGPFLFFAGFDGRAQFKKLFVLHSETADDPTADDLAEISMRTVNDDSLWSETMVFPGTYTDTETLFYDERSGKVMWKGGSTLWITNGTAVGTMSIDVPSTTEAKNWYISALFLLGNKHYIFLSDGSFFVIEQEAGTQLPTLTPIELNETWSVTEVLWTSGNETIFILTEDGQSGEKPWKISLRSKSFERDAVERAGDEQDNGAEDAE